MTADPGSGEPELTPATRRKVSDALDAAAERIALAMAYLNTQGAATAADRLNHVLQDLRTARLVDDRLLVKSDIRRRTSTEGRVIHTVTETGGQ